MTAGELADLPWPELDGSRAALLIVPLGATEQHGPHLPLGTDSAIAVTLAAGAAARLPDATVAPLLPYGASGEHQGFPGTLSIGREALELVLVELGRSASESFERLLFLSAHGGNAEPVAAAAARLRGEGREAMAWSPDWGGDAHAGRSETSLMLALAPEAVRLERAAAGNAAPLRELIGALREGGVRSVSPNGILGDPEGATAAEGRALLASAADALVTAINAWPPAAADRGATPADGPKTADLGGFSAHRPKGEGA